jgi:hypothetical protein
LGFSFLVLVFFGSLGRSVTSSPVGETRKINQSNAVYTKTQKEREKTPKLKKKPQAVVVGYFFSRAVISYLVL